MSTKKILILKKYFFEQLKNMNINDKINIFSKDKEIKFTKLNKTMFLLNGELEFKYNGISKLNSELNIIKNNEIKLKDLRKYMNWQLKYFIKDEDILYNKNVSVSKKNFENKLQTEKLFNLQKNFGKIYVNIKKTTDIEEINKEETLRLSPITMEDLQKYKLEKNEDAYKTSKSLLFYSFKSSNFYKNLKLTFDTFGVESKILNSHCIEINFGKILSKKDFIMKIESKVFTLNKKDLSNDSLEKNLMRHFKAFDKNLYSLKYNLLLKNSKSLSENFVFDANLRNENYYEFFMHITTSESFNNIYKFSNAFTKLKDCNCNINETYFIKDIFFKKYTFKYEHWFLNDLFIEIFKNYENDNNTKFLYAKEDIVNENNIVYVLDTPYKETFHKKPELKKGILTGEIYCRKLQKHVIGQWDIKTLKSLIKDIPDLLEYKFRTFTKENFNWNILPDNINKIFRRKLKDDWSGSEKYDLDYSHTDDTWYNKITQHFEIYLNTKYNFTIKINKPPFKLERKVYKNFDEAKYYKDNGNTKCICGSIKTEPFYWNNSFMGYRCKECSTNMAYDLLD